MIESDSFIFLYLMDEKFCVSTHQVANPEQMKMLGREIAIQYHKICLIGDLGVGKTTFVQGLCDTWIGHHQDVSSPTYTYSHVYDDRVLHIDMYRLQDRWQCQLYGLTDQISTYPYIVIERPQFQSYYYDTQWLTLQISLQSDMSRLVSIPPLTDQVSTI